MMLCHCDGSDGVACCFPFNQPPLTWDTYKSSVLNHELHRWQMCIWWHRRCHLLWAIVQYIPRNMHTVIALLCFVVVIHWLIFPYPPGLLHWHCGNLTIAPVPATQPWWIWINTSCEFIMNDCKTTTKQSTTKPCAYFLGSTVYNCAPGAPHGGTTGVPDLCKGEIGTTIDRVTRHRILWN